MTLLQSAIGRCFDRALSLSFTRKKFLLVFPILLFCGIFVVFCRALAFGASKWILMSMFFLPIFLCSGILLSLGVLLIRIYHHEVKNLKLQYRKVLGSSWELMIGTSYLAIPSILIYLCLWIFFGVFLLLKEIPYIGPTIGVILAFAPFLLILSFIFLAFFNLGLLFFVSAAVALRPTNKLSINQKIFSPIKAQPFTHLLFFLVALLPIGFMVGILSLAAFLTGAIYLDDSGVLSTTLQWFFIMIPFCALLAAPLIFFFNFAAETYNFLHHEKPSE